MMQNGCIALCLVASSLLRGLPSLMSEPRVQPVGDQDHHVMPRALSFLLCLPFLSTISLISLSLSSRESGTRRPKPWWFLSFVPPPVGPASTGNGSAAPRTSISGWNHPPHPIDVIVASPCSLEPSPSPSRMDQAESIALLAGFHGAARKPGGLSHRAVPACV